MPIGSGIVYNTGDLILSQVSSSGTAFLETKIASATSSLIYFDSTARINSASLNSITVGTASYVSGSTSIITNLTASNISASGTGSFGIVGIGTSTPTSKLHVIETTDTGSRIQLGTNSANSLMSATGVNDFIILTAPFGPTPASTNNNGAKWGIKLNGSIDSPNTKGKAACIYAVSEEPGAGYNRRVGLALHTSPFDLDSVERLRISNDGNVGIGTTSPNGKLHVVSPDSTYAFSVAGATKGVRFNINSSGTFIQGVDNTLTSSYQSLILGGSDLYFQTNGVTNAMYINSSGNVGIGTTSPTARLHVSGSTGGVFEVDTVGGATTLYVSASGNIGIGTTTTAARLHVNSTTSGATLLRTDGTNGTLFSVVDDLSDSLMSVNNSAGLPVLEVFADDRIVGGQYGQNDFVVVNNKVGIGTNNPTAKLQVTSSTSTPSAAFLGGNVGIGTSSPGTNLSVIGEIYASSRVISDRYASVINGNNNSILFNSNTTSFINNGSTSIYIKSDGNVGIGTTNPLDKLSVSGSIGLYAAGTTRIYNAINATDSISIEGGGGITFKTYSGGFNTVMFINTAGNVGIGTTSPTGLLEITKTSSGAVGPILFLRNNAAVANNNAVQISFAGNSGGDATTPTAKIVVTESAGALSTMAFHTYNGVSTTEKMRITNDGNVGIGTTSPTARLHVSGSTGGVFEVDTVGGATTLYVSASGNVGIGTTSPGSKLDVVGDLRVKSAGAAMILDTAAASDGRMEYKYNGIRKALIGVDSDNLQITVDTGNYLQFRTNSTERMRITNDGTVGIGTSVPGALLDVSYGDYQNAGTIRMGADLGVNTSRTNATRKWGLITGYNYTNASAAIPIIGYDSANTYTAINIGGGTSSIPASPTYISFYTTSSLSTYGAERVRIDSSGNVGIGTTNPVSLLTVGSTTTTTSSMTLQGEYQSSIFNNTNIFNFRHGGFDRWRLTTNQNSAASNDFDFKINSLDSTTTNYITFVTVKGLTGNVGIGTTAPDYLLDVSGSSRHGYRTSDTHFFTGSVNISGSLNATASWATNALTASFLPVGTYNITASWANNVVSASFATTAQTANALNTGNSYTIAGLTNNGTLSQQNTLSMGSGYQILATTGTSPIPGIAFVGDTNTGIYSPGADTIGFSISGSERVRITSGGNVGIGTSIPTNKLEVAGGIHTQGNLRNSWNDWVSNVAQFPTNSDTSPTYYMGFSVDTANRTFYISNKNNDGAATDPAGGIILRTGTIPSDRMIISYTGNVGIGTTNPVTKLQVNGNISGSSFTSSISNAVGFLGTSSWAVNTLTASYLIPTNSYTITNLTASNISASGTITSSGALINGNLIVTGSILASLFSASNIYITSSTLTVTDNIITINALSPYQRYAGMEMYDSGSGTLSSLLWDSLNNYFFISSSDAGASRQIILGPSDEASLPANYIPLISGSNNLTSSIIYQSSGNIGIGTTNPTSKLHIVQGNSNARYSLFSSALGLLIKGNDNSAYNLLTLENTQPLVNYGTSINFNLGYGGNSTTAGTAVLGARILNGAEQTWTATASTQDAYLAFYTTLDGLSGEKVRITSDGNVGIGTTSPAYKLDVSGSSRHGYQTSDTHQFTGSVSISGSVTLGGPIIYDNAVLLDYGSTSTPVVSTNYAVLQNLTGSYNSAFFDYFASSGSNFRAGTVIAGWSGSSVNYTEYATTDVGNTNQLSMSVDLSGSFVRLLTRVSTTINWNIKSAGRYL